MSAVAPVPHSSCLTNKLSAGKDADGKLDKVTRQMWDEMIADCQGDTLPWQLSAMV